MVYLITVAVFGATILGGLLALRFRDQLHLVLGFSAGAILGVAFFDLLPEALELAGSVFGLNSVMSVVALGFVIFMLIDRSLAFHAHEGEEHCQQRLGKGRFGASSLCLHSLLDGLAIGLSFQVSVGVGLVVAVAVLVHDFSDGLNTVGMILRHGGGRREAYSWLGLDAVAPVMGIFLASFLSLETAILGLILALFGGFFLYIGAGDLLPESHHAHPTQLTTLLTIIGFLLMFLVIHFISF